MSLHRRLQKGVKSLFSRAIWFLQMGQRLIARSLAASRLAATRALAPTGRCMVHRKGDGSSGMRPSKRHRAPVGAMPGTLPIPPGARASSVRLTAYGDGELIEVHEHALERAMLERQRGRVLWVEVVGLGSADVIEELGRVFGLHPLALEDAMTHQRPKVDVYPFGHYLSFRVPGSESSSSIILDQVSLFLGADYVITVAERAPACFDPVRERLRGARGGIRQKGADYMAYALLDASVDSFFPHVESGGERLDELEERILRGAEQEQAAELHAIKRDMLAVRRAVWPFRDELSVLLREEHPNITAETRLYLRDVYDHTVELLELLEAHREMAAGLLDIYLSSVSNRMNEVMKVLTIMATIFIPLSFLTGVYGMNFDTSWPLNMPELRWRYGYPFVLGLMAALALGMVVVFRRKRWL